MHTARAIATITSKGQITLPKPIRQALGVDFGGKVAFDLLGTQVVVSRVEDPEHEDPAIAGFLSLLEKDIQSGQHLTGLPEGLADSMLEALKKPVDLNQEIADEVAL